MIKKRLLRIIKVKPKTAFKLLCSARGLFTSFVPASPSVTPSRRPIAAEARPSQIPESVGGASEKITRRGRQGRFTREPHTFSTLPLYALGYDDVSGFRKYASSPEIQS